MKPSHLLIATQVAQTIGPLRRVLTESNESKNGSDERFLLVTAAGSETPELIQPERAPAAAP